MLPKNLYKKAFGKTTFLLYFCIFTSGPLHNCNLFEYKLFLENETDMVVFCTAITISSLKIDLIFVEQLTITVSVLNLKKNFLNSYRCFCYKFQVKLHN